MQVFDKAAYSALTLFMATSPLGRAGMDQA
jgi:hypothetical protein